MEVLEEQHLDLYEDMGSEHPYSENFFRTMLQSTNNQVLIKDQKEYFDLYLADTIFPCLVPGLEALAREVESIAKDSEQKID